jgi:hypothetical protein
LSDSDETYLACPVCKTPISYCQNCKQVTVSSLTRKWVGVGRSRSGYQYATNCSSCGGKVSGPSCFIATVVFQTTLDANLLELYLFRDCRLNKSQVGRRLITGYYRIGPPLGAFAENHPWLKKQQKKILLLAIFAIRRWRGMSVKLGNPTKDGFS